MEVETSGLSKTDISTGWTSGTNWEKQNVETFLQYRKKLNILIINFLSLPLAVSHEAGKSVSRRAGQFREVITSKFISLRDYQVPIKTVSSKLQVR